MPSMDRRAVQWFAIAAAFVVGAGCSAGTGTPGTATSSTSAPSGPVASAGTPGPASPAVVSSGTPGPTSPLIASRAWIAYQSGDGVSTDSIFLARTDGSEDHEVGGDVPGDIHHHPDWSPDGTHLLFDVQGEPDELWIVGVDGSDAHLATDCRLPDCVGATHASWSHDGTRLAAAYAIGPLGSDGPARLGLAIINVQSGKRSVILDHPAADGQDLYPRWSPDDRHLVFWREGGDGRTAVFRIDAGGGNLKQLSDWDIDAGDPDWSPDGTRIVYTTHPLRVFGGSEPSDLFTMAPDGSDVRQLTRLEQARATEPNWTPDGSSIIYTRTGADSHPRHTWSITADGRIDAALLTARGIYTNPVLQPLPGG